MIALFTMATRAASASGWITIDHRPPTADRDVHVTCSPRRSILEIINWPRSSHLVATGSTYHSAQSEGAPIRIGAADISPPTHRPSYSPLDALKCAHSSFLDALRSCRHGEQQLPTGDALSLSVPADAAAASARRAARCATACPSAAAWVDPARVPAVSPTTIRAPARPCGEPAQPAAVSFFWCVMMMTTMMMMIMIM